MKNIQIIDGAENSVYDIFQATEDEFAVIFPDGTDVAFSDEIFDRGNEQSLIALFTNIWKRRILKKDAHGIHGIIFYGLPEKKSSTIRREKTKKPLTPMEVGSDKRAIQ